MKRKIWSAGAAAALLVLGAWAPVQAAEKPAGSTVQTASAAEKQAKPVTKGAHAFEVQAEVLNGRYFHRRNVDLYNIHFYHQAEQRGRWTLSVGGTVERALGTTQLDEEKGGTIHGAGAVGVGPSAMLRWRVPLSGKLSMSVDGTGSLLFYDRAHPYDGRAYGFLWRIGPRLSYAYDDRGAVTLGYLFHHSSNGMKAHNPGYNGIGFSVGWIHRY